MNFAVLSSNELSLSGESVLDFTSTANKVMRPKIQVKVRGTVQGAKYRTSKYIPAETGRDKSATLADSRHAEQGHVTPKMTTYEERPILAVLHSNECTDA